MTRHRDCHNPGYQKPQFPCEICGSVLSTLNSYRKHKKAHDTPKSLVICNVCGKSIVRDNFTIHLRRHTGEKPFQCDLCPAAFVRSSLLTEHIRTHTNEKPYECSYCKKRFMVKTALNSHMQFHKGNKPFHCEFCLRRFYQKGQLKMHNCKGPTRLQLLSESTEQTSPEKISSEAPEEISRVVVSVNCDTSNTKVLESPNEVKRLVDDKAGKIIIKQLFCQKCGLKFDDFGDLHRHLYSSDESHLFRCANCQSAVGNGYIDIKMHVKKSCSRTDFKKADQEILEKNPNEKRYFCEICGQGVGLLDDVLEHHAQHINELLCCSLCDKTFLKFSDLRFHFRSHALVGQINLPCKLCSKVFFSTVPYKLHYFIVHSRLDNISYQCDLCDTLLNKEGAFISHVEGHFQSGKTHIKEGRPSKDVSRLTCEICAHILATTAALKEHRSKAHSLEDNGKLECPQCKGTIDRKRLHAHIKLHQEEKASQSKSSTNGEDVSPNNDSLHKDAKIPPSIPIPGICERCRQTFPSRKSLKKHMRIHLNEKVSTLKSDFVSPRQVKHLIAQKPIQSGRGITKKTLSSGPQRIHKCGICGKFDFSTKDLQIHMREHLNATPSRKTDGLSSGQAQLPTQRKQPEKLQSKLSSSSGINPALLSSKSEGISNVHKCGACGKSVLSKRALKEHMRTHNSDVPSVVRKEFDHATFDRFERSQTSSEAFNIVRSLKPATSPRGNSTLKPFLTFKDSLLPCSKDQTFIQPWEPNRNPSIFPYTTSSNLTLKDQVLRQHSAGVPKDLMPNHERYFRDPSEMNIELYSRRTSSSLSFIPPGEPLHRPPLEPESDRLNQRIGLQHFEAQETHQMFSRPRRIRPVSPYTKNYLNPIENSRVLSPEDNFGSLEVRRREPLLRTNFSNVPKPHESYREPSRFNDRQDSNYWNH
ncbi:hypothetical protein HUJ05_004600 [Dendroctonus ponderosae]|nr:hypothetical protein HUJ05_004600 [Dendroctonus ponderosae]